MKNEYIVVWSPVAEFTYLETLSFILNNWTSKEAEAFEQKVESLINILKTQKNLCPPSRKQRRIRKCVITPQTSLIYQFSKGNIEIIAFFDNRTNHNF
jgi:plasmid stabilization system protein ParE